MMIENNGVIGEIDCYNPMTLKFIEDEDVLGKRVFES